MIFAFLVLARSKPCSFAAGLKNEINVWPADNLLSSAAEGWRTLVTISESFHKAAAVLTIFTPASL